MFIILFIFITSVSIPSGAGVLSFVGAFSSACWILKRGHVPVIYLMLVGLLIYQTVIYLITPLYYGNCCSEAEFLRSRFWALEVFAALYMVFFANVVSLRKLRLVVLFVLWGFFFIAAAQVALDLGLEGRAVLLNNEPSEAISTLVFFLSLQLLLRRSQDGFSVIDKQSIGLALATALLINSKILLIVLPILLGFWFLYSEKRGKSKSKSKSKSKRNGGVLGLLGLAAALAFVAMGEQSSSVLNLFDALLVNGLGGLSYEYGVWDSFIVRILGWIVGLETFINYPFGIAPGIVQYEIVRIADEYGVPLSSRELAGIVDGSNYGTTKSYLLEFLVGSGLLGLAFVFYIVRIFYFSRDKVFMAIGIALFCLGIFLELAPLICYVAALVTLNNRLRKLGECYGKAS